MTPPEQAIAARLTAIAAELHLKLDRAGAEWSHGGTKGSEDCYQCSLIRAAISAETVRLTVERDEAEKWASNKEVWISRAEQAEQENARLTELMQQFDVADMDGLKHRLEDHKRWSKDIVALSICAELAEQQRDAAHAALKRYVQLVNELKAARLDPGHESLIGIDRDRAAARVLAADVALLKGISH